MSSTLKENWLEALVGLFVVAAAVLFVQFAARRTSGAAGDGNYALSASFPNVAGVAAGTDVRVSGMKVGSVIAIRLDPQTYQAKVDFTVASSVKLPADSSAAITSEGILGGSFIALVPGGDTAQLKPGDEITDTQGSTDLMGLVGSFINRGSSRGESDGDGGEATAPPATEPATP